MRYGYIHCNGSEYQTKVKALKVDEIVYDRENRKGLMALIKRLKAGDEVIVCTPKEIATTLPGLLETLDMIYQKEAYICFLNMQDLQKEELKTSILNVNRIAQDLYNESKEAKSYDETTAQKIRKERNDGVSVADLCVKYGLSRSTVYRIIQHE